MSNITYGCTALLGTNKTGKLTPDKNGYYPMILGAFNYYNNVGDYYPIDRAKALFEESSSTMRRIQNGQCRGEYGHPKKKPGMTYNDYFNRMVSISEDNISHHIKSVWLDDKSVKDESGKSIIVVMGKVKPCGPRGDILKSSLDNPDENVAFSIRSLTDNVIISGVRHKHVKTIIAWDFVNEPGLAVANKYEAPSLEGISEDVILTPEILDTIEQLTPMSSMGIESTGINYSMLRTELGWVKTQSLSAASRSW